MATDMTLALREFARKKLSEAKQKGATLATATAATLSSSVAAAPAPFVFRSPASQQSQPPPVDRRRASLDRKLETLHHTNDFLHESLTGSATAAAPADSLDGAVYKMELINESLAFSIENIQECAHVMKLLNRQLRDSAAMKDEAHKTFYRPTPLIQDGSHVNEIRYEY
ncbi:hypothetical protein PybrP1_012786 [[Pythium] brassicae (nom. inval.)]|nr:hypothetical protein PybrP1_012786 [[Pythium] brassicae (nom. inval.)]